MCYINKVTVLELLAVNSVSLETPFVAIYETSPAHLIMGQGLLGLIAQKQHWERAFQANTTRHRRVLSIIRLGREVRKRTSDYKIDEAQIRWAIGQYISWVHKEGRPFL